ncbi:MAG: autotransporter-associated beta strand repeat-containing protein, partial [Thermoguttaceae bacterium]
MKNKKCSFAIAATLAMLIAAQFVMECRGDDGGTLCGLLAISDGSTMCLPSGGDSGTTTFKAAALIHNNDYFLNTTSGGSLDLAGNATFKGGILQAGIVSNATVSGGTFTQNVLKSSGCTLTLSGYNTYTGPTTISGGTLQFSNSGTNSDGTLVVGGYGGLVKVGAGTITLSGYNTYTGSTTINGGTLQIDNASLGTVQIGNAGIYGSLPSNVTILNGTGTLNNNGLIDIQAGTLQLDNSGTISGITLAADGYGGLTKSGAGTLTLSGSYTYTGTTIANGVLQLGNSVTQSDISGGTFNIASINSGGTINGDSINTVSLVYNAGSLVAGSIKNGTLTIGSGATVQLVSLSGI